MKFEIKSFLSGLLLATTSVACQPKDSPSTVKSVDLQRYSGVWYELASYPQFFERGCSNVKATYTPKNGYVEVLNQSIKKGKPNDIKGKAFVVPNSGNARLKVQFFWPFKGDYWIVNLAEDYSWAIVSDPKRKTMWILSRAPKMDEKIYNSLIVWLVINGYDKNKIVIMEQNGN